MRKMIYKITLLLAALALLAGCASKSAFTAIDIPRDPNYIFGGPLSAEGARLNIAIERAEIAARSQLARNMELRLQSMMKDFVEQVGGGQSTELNELYTRATKIVVDQQQRFAFVKEMKYREIGSGYEAWVLVEYPIGAARGALYQHVKNNEEALYNRFRASEAFNEMEKDVAEYNEWKQKQGM